MKARRKMPRAISFYYPSAPLASPEAKITRDDGTEIATLKLEAVTESSNLFMSKVTGELQTVLFDGATTSPETPDGIYTVRYSHLVDNVRTVIFTETLEVGPDPVPDFKLSTLTSPVFYLSDESVGDTSSVVTLQILDSSGTLINSGAATLPKYTGDVALTTVPLSDTALSSQADHLVFRVNSEDVADNKSVVFKATGVTLAGAAGTFTGADANTTATYEINGTGVVRSITLDGTADGVDAYAAALNTLMSGVGVTTQGGQLSVASDRKGSTAAITITPGTQVGNNWAAKVGLSGTVVADVALNNVANADAITTAEIANRIESDVMTTLVGDLVDVAIGADNKLMLQVQTGTAGSTSTLELVSGESALVASLGLSGLTIARGLDAGSIVCPHSATDSMYVATPQPISKEDNYTLIWYDDGVIAKVEQKLGLIAGAGLNINLGFIV